MKAAATSPNGDDVLGAIMGHPCLWAPAPVSLPEALYTTHSALCQVRHAFQLERDKLEAEWPCLRD
jgi:hypothetical protein